MNSVAAQPSARPLYAVFLERVIQIEAVQRHRAAVTDDDMAQFFFEGLPPWTLGDSRSLKAPMAFSWGWPGRVEARRSVSLPMQHAWNAAPAAFEEFIKALKNGELIASGVHPATGARYDLDPAEWTRRCLILDVRNGDLIEVEVDSWLLLASGKRCGGRPSRCARRNNPGKRKHAGTAMTGRERGPTQQPYAPRTSGIGGRSGGTRTNPCRRGAGPSKRRSRNGSRRGATFPT